MSIEEINEVIGMAEFIVAGYAFIQRKDNLISVVSIDPPHHAAVIDKDGNVLETNMYDIELDIVVNKYWANNKKQIISQEYA